MSLPGPVWLFLIASFFIDLVGAGCEAFARYHLKLLFPYSTPVLNEVPAPDLLNFVKPFSHIHTAQFFSTAFSVPYMYPAPVAPLYSFFLNLPMRVRVFHCLSAGILLAAAIGFSFYVWRRGVPAWQAALVGLGSLLLSYPALFELKQANMEIFICILVGAGVWCFATGRHYMAAACIGVAIAMKLFPFVYLGLFIPGKRYRPLLTALAVAALVTLASLAYLGPTIPVAWHGIGTDLHYYQQTVPSVMREQIGYDHSLFALCKRAIHQVFHRQKTDARFDTLLRIYMPVVGVFGVLIYFLRIRKLPFANQVLCLSIASVLLPPTSYDYTLLHLYIPWALLVLIALRAVNEHMAGMRGAFLCFAVTMSIETELILHARSFGGQIKAITLIALFVFALLYPFTSGVALVEDRAA